MPRIKTRRGVRTIRRTQKTIKKKVAVLTRKVKNAEAPFASFVNVTNDIDIKSVPLVQLLEVQNSLPSTDPSIKTLLKNIQFKGTLQMTFAEQETSLSRIVVVMDKRKFDNDDAPLWLDVFKENNVHTLRADTLGGEKTKSFQILSDRTYALTRDANVTQISKRVIHWNKSYKIPIQQFDYATYSKNLIYLMFITTAGDNNVELVFQNSVLMSRDE